MRTPGLPVPTLALVASSALVAAFASLLAGCSADSGPEPGDPIGEHELVEHLQAIDGMISVEQLDSSAPGYTLYALVYEQPVDHQDPGGATFAQHMTLLHRDASAPMVLASTGYYNYLIDQRTEPTRLLAGNQLVVEHRYFADSRPEPADWSRLTIEQAAADHHRIVQALAPIYTGPWVSTGASKGGMTSVYHRRFYPDDVAATIAYVAPISFAAPDDRYISFFATVGDSAGESACRQRVRDLQREALTRLAELAALADSYAGLYGYTFELLGGTAAAVEQGVSEFEWGFWQYLGVPFCGRVPTSVASDAAIFDFINQIGTIDYVSDQLILLFQPYYYQSETQLGYPVVPTAHLDDLLQYRPDIAALLPQGVPVEHDPAPMLDMAAWVAEQGTELMFVYGEYDPWTAGAFDTAGNPGAHVFTAAATDHGATIADLSLADRAEALALLESWTGVAVTGASMARQSKVAIDIEPRPWRLEPWLRPARR